MSFEEICGILFREELGSGLKMHSPYTTLPDKTEVAYFDKAVKNPKRVKSDTAPLKRKKKGKNRKKEKKPKT